MYSTSEVGVGGWLFTGVTSYEDFSRRRMVNDRTTEYLRHPSQTRCWRERDFAWSIDVYVQSGCPSLAHRHATTKTTNGFWCLLSSAFSYIEDRGSMKHHHRPAIRMKGKLWSRANDNVYRPS